jgi:hypothetical protein
MKTLLALLLAVSVTNINAEERYMPNDAGGFMVLTDEPCTKQIALDQGFLNRAYADDTEYHYEGCWTRYAPPEHLQDRAEPFVSTWWAKGLTATYKQKLFSTEKKRWQD